MNDNYYQMPDDIEQAEKEAQELHQGRLDAVSVRAYILEDPKRANVLVDSDKMLRIIKAATTNRESELSREIDKLREKIAVLTTQIEDTNKSDVIVNEVIEQWQADIAALKRVLKLYVG